jgi:hypothetical protein
MSRFFYFVSVILLCTLPIAAQNATSDCPKRVEYINRNEVDPPMISLRGIEGRAVDSSGEAVPNVCVALFTEKERRFVAQTLTDENGYFRFEKISSGDYRLVGRLEYDYLCPVNVRVRRVTSTSGSGKKKLVLHVQPAAIDDCSYGDVKWPDLAWPGPPNDF